MKIFFSFLTVVMASCTLFSQTGPGGIGSSSENSFWLDANRLSYVNNDNVAVFDDVSTNGNSFSQLVSTRQPIFKTAAVNGLPVVEFDGVNDYMRSGSISDLESAELTWYVVYKNTSNGGGILGGSYTSRVKQWLSYSISSGLNINGQYSSGSLKWAGFTQATGSYLFSGTHVSATDIKSYRNSTLMGTKIAPYTAGTGHNYVALGHVPGVTYTGLLDGCVAEAFAFNTTLNDLERVIVDNYLGAKYNIGIANDFYAYEATHNIDVIGIGDNGTDIHSNSKGAGFVSIANPVSMGTGEYLFVGHDGAALFPLVNTDMPAGLITSHERYDRTWRVGETGEVGNLTVTFNLGSSFGFANAASYYILVDTDDDFSNSTATIGVYNALNQTVSFVVNLADGDYFTLAGEPVPAAVNAIANGDWSNTSTWDCACVPSGFQTVNINAFTVDFDIDGFAKTLNIGLTGALNWVSSEQLVIKENLEIFGSIDMVDGSIAMNGDGVNQSLDVNSQVIEMNELIINNPGATVTVLNGTIGLNGLLSLESGDFNVNSTNLIVRSDSPVTSGRVGEIFPSASITGSVSVERFIASGVAGNRNLSSPVLGETLSAWDNDLAISGSGFPDGCAYGAFGDSSNGCYYSVKKHQGSAYIDVTNINETLLPGVGYEIFIGDNLTTFSGATVTTTGTLHSGSYSTPSFSYFWNLQGNPFASPISFPGITRSHVENYFYIFDAASGSYQWYDGATNTHSIPTLANGVLAIGQGYWTGNWGFMTYPQACKTGTSATFIRNTEVENGLQLTLKEDNSTHFNVTSLSLAEQASDKTDVLDIHYLSTGRETASSLYMVYDDTVKLAKNYLERNGKKKVVDFNMNCKTDAYYTISPSNLSDLQDYNNVYLFDKTLNKMVDLKAAGGYTFYSTIGNTERFTVILTNDVLSDKNYINGSVYAGNGNVSIKQLGHTLEIYNEVGQEGLSIEVTNVVGQKIVDNYLLDNTNGKQYLTVSDKYSGIFIAIVRSGGNIVATKKIIL